MLQQFARILFPEDIKAIVEEHHQDGDKHGCYKIGQQMTWVKGTSKVEAKPLSSRHTGCKQ